VADAIRDLEVHKPRLIVSADADLDAPNDTSSDGLGPARIYFHSHYRKLKTFANSMARPLFGSEPIREAILARRFKIRFKLNSL
jgi:hypothetical protein